MKKKSIFEPIKCHNIATGLKKKKKTAKNIDILKEDRQAFGLLVGKVRTQGEALPYPLTSSPLALAFPDNTLRQSQKAPLRNLLIEDAKALCKQQNEVSDWFIDGMAAVNSIGSKKDTWKEYADKFLKYCMPKDSSRVNSLSIIFDSYKQNSIKQMTQLERAGGEIGRNV